MTPPPAVLGSVTSAWARQLTPRLGSQLSQARPNIGPLVIVDLKTSKEPARLEWAKFLGADVNVRLMLYQVVPGNALLHLCISWNMLGTTVLHLETLW